MCSAHGHTRENSPNLFRRPSRASLLVSLPCFLSLHVSSRLYSRSLFLSPRLSSLFHHRPIAIRPLLNSHLFLSQLFPPPSALSLFRLRTHVHTHPRQILFSPFAFLFYCRLPAFPATFVPLALRPKKFIYRNENRARSPDICSRQHSR